MAARAGMGTIITTLRAYTAEPGTVTYSDDTMQAVLDSTRRTHKNLEVKTIDVDDPYTEYLFPFQVGEWVEQNETGSGWALVDSNGDAAPSYTVNYQARLITFASDTSATIYYLSCREYDLNAAAAEIWRRKAAAVAAQVDFETDNHRFAASQKLKHYMEQAAYYEGLAASEGTLEMFRDDMR